MSPARQASGRLARAAALAVAALSLTALAGCGPEYDHTSIDNVKASPLGGFVSYGRIEVPVGMIVTAHIVSYNDERKEMATEIVAEQPGVVEVTRVVSANDFAFFGLRPGTSDIRMIADGKLVLVVTAVVTDQPALP